MPRRPAVARRRTASPPRAEETATAEAVSDDGHVNAAAFVVGVAVEPGDGDDGTVVGKTPTGVAVAAIGGGPDDPLPPHADTSDARTTKASERWSNCKRNTLRAGKYGRRDRGVVSRGNARYLTCRPLQR